jgi:ATP-dependent RNA helicase DDX49/DBP8
VIAVKVRKVKAMDKLGIDDWLVRSCAAVGIHNPTPIQSLSIPAILKTKKNICGRAQTGSGKTAAFALPMLHKLAKDPYGVFAIILTPARELAMQIADQLNVFGASCALEVCTAIGGLDFVQQGIEIEARPHFIVATPGRLADIVRSRNGIPTTELAYLVFDEADRLLSPEFAEDINTIMESLQSSNYQTLLFSATLDSEISLSRDLFPFMPQDFEFMSVSESSTTTVDDVTQRYVFMPLTVKDSCLVRILKHEEQYAKKETSIIVFVSTKKTCEIISALLTELEVENVALHSGISQARRLASLGKFKSRLVRIMVATDVASRGLDIPSVDLVVNYDLPYTPKDYVHRIGRTGRAGKIGDSITLVSQFDIEGLLEIEKLTGKKMTELQLKDDHIAELMKKVNPAKRIAQIRLEEYLDKKKELRRREQVKRRIT